MSHEEVADFIRASFRSAWALELMLLLRKDHDRALTHEEMVQGLRGSELIVRQSLEGLAAAGLIVPEADGSARYSPASREADEMVERAATLYARSPNAVRRMIVEAANPGITAFADSFKLKKD